MSRIHALVAVFSVLAFLLTLSTRTHAQASRWRIPDSAALLTKWARQVDPKHPLPQYPRPQMVRRDWMNLNGLWEYAEAAPGEAPPVGKTLRGTVLVPYPFESALSGVMRGGDRFWYRRLFTVPSIWKAERCLLHFGAVDWEAAVYVNGELVGTHRGGYDQFSLDITGALKEQGPQEILLGVYDPSDAGEQPRGKQVKKPGGIWYTPSTGIWQTVWIEPVPEKHVEAILITPDVDRKQLRLSVAGVGTSADDRIQATAFDGSRVVAKAGGRVGEELTLSLGGPKLWSPESPFLYDLRVALLASGKKADEVKSYFGMRKVELAKDAQGVSRIAVNGEFLMQVGPLDQGFWPDGLYTAPTDEALRFDIEMTRKLGFNMARKHVKVEPDRWYYWADKLGLLVWQDMPSGENKSPEARTQFERELTRLVQTHRNHPSIIMWVVFNEGWGQYDTERLTAMVKALDPTRLVNNASGWTDKGAGDVMDIHSYPKPRSPKAEGRRAIVLGEFGGLGLAIPGHTWKKEHWGYQGMTDNKELTAKYESFLQTVYELRKDPGLSAAVYTQTTDVEVECNGLLTYDRAVVKPDRKRVAAVNKGDLSNVPQPPVVKSVVPTSQNMPAIWQYTTVQPPADWYKLGFNDGAWERGPAGFGTKETPGAIVRTEWGTNDIWLRREFEMGEGTTDDLFLSVHHDDQAEVYINGVLAGGIDGWTSEYEYYAITPEAKRALKSGKNLLAVHCHQRSGGQYIDAGIVRMLEARKRSGASGSAGETSVVKKNIPQRRGGLYTANREPLTVSPFMKLPIGSITPKGWLLQMLRTEKDGMTGHLAEISPWLNFETSAWANRQGEGQRGWEELPYWLKGFGDLGYVLKDQEVITEVRKWIEAILLTQREDGYFGPRALLTSLDGGPDMWPHMVVLNVLQSFYEHSGDGRVLPFMTKYFRWQNNLPPAAFGAGYWPKIRMGDNIESVYWLFNRTGEAFLLDLAGKIFRGMARWDEDVINWHNVNIAQGFRAPAVYYMGARDITLLDAAERNYRKVMEEYGQFPGGGFAADENARPGFTDPRQGFETCGIVEFLHSFEMLTKISGNPVWSDRCEDLAFNSFPAALKGDMRGLRYLSCANQVQLDKKTKAPGVQNGGTMFAYSPFEVYRCCQHNVSHGWPYFAEELWLATADSGVCASLYAPSEVALRVGGGTGVRILEETSYPFGETVSLKISSPETVRFPLYLRIPGWCEDASVRVNGQVLDLRADPGRYLILDRSWKDGDAVTLDLAMRVTVRSWVKNKNAVSVNYGPLTFALKIGERWERYGTDSRWPEWEVYPTTPWNYGLLLSATGATKSFTVKKHEGTASQNPFTADAPPVSLMAHGRRIPGWQLDYLGLVGPLQESPARTDMPVEEIELIPMGMARLRIASFPTVTEEGGGMQWTPQPGPRPIDFAISVSHMNQYDTKEAVADGFEPKASNDESVPRFTWWNHRGTAEWIQYDFPKPRTVSSVAVYWFDDGAGGATRLPRSWRLLYRKNDAWLPVEEPTGFGTEANRFNDVRFKQVETTGMRLEVQLRPESCAGILEWKLNE